MADKESRPWLTSEEENEPSGWLELGLDGLGLPGTEVPFRLFARRFKSSSPDAEWFLHDPLGMLLEERAFADSGFNRSWKITTFVVNHHRTLSRIQLSTMAVVAPEEQTVALTIYKKDSGS